MKALFSFLLLAFLYSGTAQAADPSLRVKMKLNYAKTVIVDSKGAQRIRTSDNEEAKEMLEQAMEDLEEAREEFEDEDYEEAEELVNIALKAATKATQMVPDKEARLKADKNRYNQLYLEVLSYKNWNKDNPDLAEDADLDMDAIMVEVDVAHKESKKQEYDAANKRLQLVLNDIVAKTSKAVQGKVSVFDKNFETAEEEFHYERKRNDEYERLQDVAIEKKVPGKGVIMLMGRFKKKAISLREDANAHAEDENYSQAIAKLQASTEEYLKALKMVGVK